jgi:transaldolase
VWASIGAKNPDYFDVRYISEQIGRDVVNTMPEHTLQAFADHGVVARTHGWCATDARRGRGPRLDLAAVTAQLEHEGVRSCCDSYHQLLDCIERKLAAGAR